MRRLKFGHQINQGAVVDSSSVLRRGNGKTDRQMSLANSGRPGQDNVLLALEEPGLGEAHDLLALD